MTSIIASIPNNSHVDVVSLKEFLISKGIPVTSIENLQSTGETIALNTKSQNTNHIPCIDTSSQVEVPQQPKYPFEKTNVSTVSCQTRVNQHHKPSWKPPGHSLKKLSESVSIVRSSNSIKKPVSTIIERDSEISQILKPSKEQITSSIKRPPPPIRPKSKPPIDNERSKLIKQMVRNTISIQSEKSRQSQNQINQRLKTRHDSRVNHSREYLKSKEQMNARVMSRPLLMESNKTENMIQVKIDTLKKIRQSLLDSGGGRKMSDFFTEEELALLGET